jgi:hypothetical protein
VRRFEGFNSSSKDDGVALLELVVVLVHILEFFVTRAKHKWWVPICCAKAKPNAKISKLLRLNTRKVVNESSNSVILKSRSPLQVPVSLLL